MLEIVCHFCQHQWSYEPPLSRSADCPHCRRPCKVCLNCRDYDPRAHHECRENQAEWVKYKDTGNFCSYFVPRGKASAAGSEVAGAQAALAALFGDSQQGSDRTVGLPASAPVGAPPKASDPQQDLHALFKGRDDQSADDASQKKEVTSLQDELARFLKSK